MSAQSLYMSLQTVFVEKGKSFEEVRIEDYLQAYSVTGKPPTPVQQVPAGDLDRTALGLPLLFKPIPEPDLPSQIQRPPLPIQRPLLPIQHPPSQILHPSSQIQHPPVTSSTVTSSKSDPKKIPPFHDFEGKRVENETFFTISCSLPYSRFSLEELRHLAYQAGHKHPPEVFQSITMQPEFAQHSFEELRVMYKVANRELTSAEIIAMSQD